MGRRRLHRLWLGHLQGPGRGGRHRHRWHLAACAGHLREEPEGWQVRRRHDPERWLQDGDRQDLPPRRGLRRAGGRARGRHEQQAGLDGFTISEVAKKLEADYGKVDVLIHSLANGPEVIKPLMETSRRGYLAASSASAYFMVSLVQKFAPIMSEGGGVISLTYIASEKVIPGYGGGMSSAKAQLESDTRVLAFEAGRKYGIRVNTISAGPLKSRAASAIGKEPGQKTFIEYAIDYSKENSPISQDLYNDDVGNAGLFLLSPLARTITGTTMYVDNGLNIMGMAVNSKSFEGRDMVPP